MEEDIRNYLNYDHNSMGRLSPMEIPKMARLMAQYMFMGPDEND